MKNFSPKIEILIKIKQSGHKSKQFFCENYAKISFDNIFNQSIFAV
jgi:hypothetical protein